MISTDIVGLVTGTMLETPRDTVRLASLVLLLTNDGAAHGGSFSARRPQWITPDVCGVFARVTGC